MDINQKDSLGKLLTFDDQILRRWNLVVATLKKLC